MERGEEPPPDAGAGDAKKPLQVKGQPPSPGKTMLNCKRKQLLSGILFHTHTHTQRWAYVIDSQWAVSRELSVNINIRDLGLTQLPTMPLWSHSAGKTKRVADDQQEVLIWMEDHTMEDQVQNHNVWE